MLTRKLLVLAALVLSAVPAATSFAEAGTHSPCILDQYHPTSVKPYRVPQTVGKSSVPQLKGAEIFVQARPGLTAEWLQLQLARHIESMQNTSMHDCALDVSGTRVQVDPAGTGFRVKLIAKDAHQAQEVLRRAQLLVG